MSLGGQEQTVNVVSRDARHPRSINHGTFRHVGDRKITQHALWASRYFLLELADVALTLRTASNTRGTATDSNVSAAILNGVLHDVFH